MQRTATLLVLTVVLTGALPLAAEEAFEYPPRPTGLVDGPMNRLAPLVGTWEISGAWANGQALWARNEYRVGLGGRFLEVSTFAKDGEGQVYHRYDTVFAYDKEKDQYMSYGFTFDGTTMTVPLAVEEQDGKLALTSQWKTSEGGEVKQTVTLSDAKAYDWKVWTRADTEGEWTVFMDDQWQRVD